MHKAVQILLGWCVFDALFTFIFRTNGLIVEKNPLVLWTLEKGWVYWVGRLAILGLLVGLIYLTKISRLAKISASFGVAFYTAIYFQLFTEVI